jgi:Flp pilus assembly protein TadG
MTRRPLRTQRSRNRPLTQDRRGVAAVEFAVVAPVFLAILFGILATGMNGFYQLTLDDAVRDAARQVQMNAPAASTSGGFVAAVCARFSPLASDCSTKISYSVQASTAAGGFAGLTPEQISASGTLSDSFFLGNAYAPKTPVLIQVAYPLPFKLPYIGTILTKSGTNSVLASAAVLAEPYQ